MDKIERTMVAIPKPLHAKAKAAADVNGRKLTAWVAEAVAEKLAKLYGKRKAS